ncbi:MAG TPA: BTAD domain-containing putative transcriptional regulator [Gaiellaceae bacterium]|nr:BTAD domain-containing putative transcriptional regulator [Gaiellaceae bacterium]
MARTSSPLRPDAGAPRRHDDASEDVVLHLLAGFGVEVSGEEVSLPGSAQRVVAFVALHERPVLRTYVAGTLWLDSPEPRAAGSLRSALWRIHRHTPELVLAEAETLRLGPEVRVDLREAETRARTELSGDSSGSEPDTLTLDLLPDWYDDWVLIERERFRQLRLRALESMCTRLAAAGRADEALDAGLLALAGEPLRESAHRALVSLHLAEGNAAEALRQFWLCRRLLHDQLGVEPSPLMLELIAGLDARDTSG